MALARAVCEDIAKISSARATLRVGAEGVVPMAAETGRRFALIVAELVINAVKHSSGPERAGSVDVRCCVENGSVFSVLVSNDGKELPSGFDLAAQKGMGLRMSRALAAQIGGTLEATPKQSGAAFELRVPSEALSAP
jgi:two-component sensor histidine kinase